MRALKERGANIRSVDVDDLNILHLVARTNQSLVLQVHLGSRTNQSLVLQVHLEAKTNQSLVLKVHLVARTNQSLVLTWTSTISFTVYRHG